MIVNAHRGEVSATLDGRQWRLCLTLGALAELESAFGADDLSALAVRFSTGKLAANDIVRILGAGLRGGGAVVSDGEVSIMRSPDGIAGFVQIVGALLQATFGVAEEAAANPPVPQQA